MVLLVIHLSHFVGITVVSHPMNGTNNKLNEESMWVEWKLYIRAIKIQSRHPCRCLF